MLNLNIIVIIFISCLQVIALARNCEGHFKEPLSSQTKENLFRFRTHLLSKAESKLISRNRIYSVNEEVIVDGETYRIIGINGESIFTRSYLAEKDGEIFEIERYFEKDSFHESLAHLLKIYPETKYKSDNEENSYLLVNHRGDGDDLELAKNRHIARLSEPPYPILETSFMSGERIIAFMRYLVWV